MESDEDQEAIDLDMESDDDMVEPDFTDDIKELKEIANSLVKCALEIKQYIQSLLNTQQ